MRAAAEHAAAADAHARAAEPQTVRRLAATRTPFVSTSARKTGDPPPQPPLELLDEIREKLWNFTVSVFRLDRDPPAHAGMATCVAAKGNHYLLTARHVWEVLRASGLAVSLEAERSLIPIDHQLVETKTVSRKGPQEWGPDLARIRIPDPVARDVQQLKAFYDLARHRPEPEPLPDSEQMSLWAVLGAPAEQSKHGPQETVLTLSLFDTWTVQTHERNGYDYYDLQFHRGRRPALPETYRGVSGSGLWQIPVTLRSDRTEISWSGAVRLTGVAFYEINGPAHQDVIRCHGPKSLKNHLLEDVA